MGGVPEALVVGASGYNDWREGYSNIGSCLDVFAPGGGITSAYAGNDTGFTTMSGTSMATPHVSGAAALYLQQKPGAAPAEVVAAITGSATRGVIQDAGLSSPNRLLFTPHFGDRVAPTISLVEPRTGAIVRGTQRLIAAAEDDVELNAVAFFAGGKHPPDRFDRPVPRWSGTRQLFLMGCWRSLRWRTDLAGNRASARLSITVRNRQDRTPPHVSGRRAAGGDSDPVGTDSCQSPSPEPRRDDVAPINSVSFRIQDEYGRVQPSGSASVTGGRFSITVLLEATRRGQDVDGRRYMLNVTARDLAANEASAIARVTVKHDNR